MKAPSCAILMYHKVGAPVGCRRDRFLNVAPGAFARQVRILRALRFEAVTFDRALRGLACTSPLPRRAVCLTFDDAYACVHEHAAPVLSRVGWPATVFVATSFVGRSDLCDTPLGVDPPPVMGWGALAELQAAGWEIGGHTRRHGDLSAVSADDAREDIEGGIDDTSAHLGLRPTTFCYPGGRTAPCLPAILRAAGFAGACTTRSGIATGAQDPFLLPRVKVAYRDGVAGMLYRLLVRPHLG